MTLLAAKVLLAPLCVVAVSLAGRRWRIATAALAVQATTFLLRSRLQAAAPATT